MTKIKHNSKVRADLLKRVVRHQGWMIKNVGVLKYPSLMPTRKTCLVHYCSQAGYTLGQLKASLWHKAVKVEIREI